MRLSSLISLLLPFALADRSDRQKTGDWYVPYPYAIQHDDGGGKFSRFEVRQSPRATEPELEPEPAPAPHAVPSDFERPDDDLKFLRQVPLLRMYSGTTDTHRFHSDMGVMNEAIAAGYRIEGILGFIADADSGDPSDITGCKFVELFALTTKEEGKHTEMLTASKRKAKKHEDKGWERMKGRNNKLHSSCNECAACHDAINALSIGFCPKNKECGATKPLRAIAKSDGRNILYTVTENEYNTLNKENPFYKGGGSGVLCYLF